MLLYSLNYKRAFGLRMKEAALLKHHMSDKENYLAVNWGTKGGRDRVVPTQNDYQRDVLTRAKPPIDVNYTLTQHTIRTPDSSLHPLAANLRCPLIDTFRQYD